ncbi:hypothetical protein ONE63_011256 [Megalurothrips usitatus]|uniref:LEM domain-containing protein n=1 Tax=Megalurothrips usitatus TaxID=439358 RepID=A0AAV7X3R9_9NEOP|nr:hypothetical protein ONE63_011256 [Megalurothrips usitatus]
MSPKGYAPPKLSLALQLFEAVEEKNLQDVLTLLDRDGADPNFIIPQKGISPFHLLIGSECSYFAEEATRAFLQRSGNPNVRSEDGLTPVHVAAVWGRTGLLALLLSCGGDPWMRDAELGFTPLHFALKEKHWEAALILQRFQLMDRRNRHSDVHAIPRFNINLETVVVSAGEMQAEYAASSCPQDNLSPVFLSPVQASKKVNDKYDWNIEPLETNEYVRQWCHKEFTPLPVTSTPTHHKTLNCGVAGQNHGQTVSASNNPNITSSKAMTPKNVEYCTGTASPTGVSHSKNMSKPTTDVRKNLFLELKKRFNGLKQSFDLSKDDSSKRNLFERSSGYFGRKSLRKSMQKAKTSCPETAQEKTAVVGLNDSTCASGYLSFKTSRSTESEDGGNGDRTSPGIDCGIQSSLENSPVDEVDAVPLNNSVDTSVEWIASQSCFLEERSPDSSNSQSFVTCDEGPSLNVSSVAPLHHAVSTALHIPIDPPQEAPKRPPRRKQLRALNSTLAETVPSSAPSTVSFGTIISEEYRYTDDDAGVVLIESHLLTKPLDVPSPSDSESVVSVPNTVISDAPTATTDISSVPASFCYDSVALRKELVSLGENVGPITTTTKKVYLRRLYRLKKKNRFSCTAQDAPTYTPELHRVLKGDEWETDALTYAKYEKLMCAPFENPDPNRRWREGLAKSSFNYLLLDPRLSNNLPANVTVYDLSTWRQFLSAVFYIGKGKRSRPYAHLYQAVHSWSKGERSNNSNAKVIITSLYLLHSNFVCVPSSYFKLYVAGSAYS